MKNRDKLWCNILIYFLLNTFALSAQTRSDKYLYPEINGDGTVTFRYFDTSAKRVKILCDCKLRKEKKTIKTETFHSAKMKRDSTGTWTYTTPVMPAEVYTYQFQAGRKRIVDPQNPDSVRVHRNKRSVFIVSGTKQSNLYVTDSLKGNVDTIVYHNSDSTNDRNILIYTPPQYSDSTIELPVLYLLHGLNGNETAWNDRGRAVQILENLIEEQKAEPMILVMPDANPNCLIAQKEDVGLFKNVILYPSWNKREFELSFENLDDFLSENYRFSKKSGSRAVAGLSAGAKQAANLAIMYDSTFSSVGMFSPVVNRKQIPDNLYAKFWIGGGSGDLFHRKINRYRKKMQHRHIPYTMYCSSGGHTWRNWRVYFTEYVQTLFHN